MKAKKPRPIVLYDGTAECLSEDYDDKGGGAFCVSVEASAIYDSKNVRKLILWLEKAERWIHAKENPAPRKRK